MPGLATFVRTSLLIQGAVEILLALAIAINGVRTSAFAQPSRFGLAVTLITAFLTLVFGATQCFSAWAWRRRKPYARRLVFLVSILDLPILGFGSLLGGLGIYLCSGRRASKFLEYGGLTKRSPRPGDGTNRWAQFAWPALSIGWWIFSSKTIAELAVARNLPPAAPLKGIPLVVLVTIVTVVIHELGHCVAGWVSDFTLFRLQVGPLVANCKNGRWSVAFSPSGLFANGAVGMAPLHAENLRGRMAFLTAGGLAGSLLFAAVCGLLSLVLVYTPMAEWWNVPAMIAMWSLGDFFLNLIPILGWAGYSDGAVMAQLIEGGAWADVRMAMAMSTSPVSRPAEMDSDLLRRAIAGSDSQTEQTSLKLLLVAHSVDRNDTPRAMAVLASVLERPELLSDPALLMRVALYVAFVDQNCRSARRWLDQAVEMSEAKRHDINGDLEYWTASAAILWLEGKLSQAENRWKIAWRISATQPPSGFNAYQRWLLTEVRNRGNRQATYLPHTESLGELANAVCPDRLAKLAENQKPPLTGEAAFFPDCKNS